MPQESSKKQPEGKKCLRCGQCCLGCPHLRYGRKHSWCHIWKKRNQAIRDEKYLIISGHACLPRKLDIRIFPGCPLNRKEKG